jgi:hypothetical protein
MRITRHKSAIGAGALALCAGLCSPAARAAEHITLANGFDLICNHHQLVDGKVRIYLKASEPDYFELDPQAITGYETVPDPVAVAPLAARTEPAEASKPAQFQETRLTSEDLHQLLSKAGAEHNVDEDLLASVVKAESGGYTRAVSRTGARGLMQLMPGTAHQLGVADSFQPEHNVQGGTAYLDALLSRYHDNIALALAAYNAGPEAVDRYHGIPPYHETQVYVARVVHEFNRRVLARRKAAHTNPVLASAQMHGAGTTTGGNAETGRD